MRRLLSFAVVILLTACAGPGVRPSLAVSEVRAIDDLALVSTVLAESPKRTLLVLDIDDTLLTSDNFFGSDKWYEWQHSLAADDPRPNASMQAIAETYADPPGWTATATAPFKSATKWSGTSYFGIGTSRTSTTLTFTGSTAVTRPSGRRSRP